jgi:hypothetical protein
MAELKGTVKSRMGVQWRNRALRLRQESYHFRIDDAGSREGPGGLMR